ncbi:MAG: hypothetical protein ACLFQB_14890 [Chitinispirillaceae bacterium]
MSIFRTVLIAGLVSATALFAQEEDVDLTAPVVLDDFDDAYGDPPNQATFGAAYGIINYGSYYDDDAGGYWYTFADEEGSSITNSEGEEIEAKDNEETMVVDEELHVNLNTSNTDAENPFAGIGFGFTDDSTNYLDLSDLDSLTFKAKGSGEIRIYFETEDIHDAGYDWGFYGVWVDLTSDWETYTFSADDLLPEEWSEVEEEGWDWSHGSSAVNKFSIQCKEDDAEVFMDDIAIEGMTWGDLEDPNSPVAAPKVNSKIANIFSVSNNVVSFKLAETDNLNVTLNNLKGETVRNLYTGRTAAHSVNLSNLNLANGQYFVVIDGKNAKYTQPISIAK